MMNGFADSRQTDASTSQLPPLPARFQLPALAVADKQQVDGNGIGHE
jgi:hypothetical protein